MHVSFASAHLVCAAVLGLAEGACLPIEDGARRNLTFGVQSIPLGIFKLTFGASPMIVAEIFKILVEERLFYNVAYSGSGSTSPMAAYALSGCAAPSNYVYNPKCSNNAIDVFVHHISFEVWDTAASEHLRRLGIFFEKVAPLDLGSIGYDGIETMFVPDAPLKKAYAEEGATLEYYRAWKKATVVNQHFSSHLEIPLSQLLPCGETRLMDAVAMANYLKFTGDSQGLNDTRISVEGNSVEGSIHALCWDFSWWLAPACRDTPDKCVPLVTGGNGWLLEGFMQKAAEYELPLAIGVAATYNDYLALPEAFDMLFYWWNPDSAFTSKLAVEIFFPQHDSIAWAAGDKRTAAYRTTLRKLTYVNFAMDLPDVYDLARELTFTPQEIDFLLVHMQLTSMSIEALSCQWIRNNTATWERWLPNELRCPVGQGLVDASNIFTSDNRNATGCQACPPGSQSMHFNAVAFRTHICQECGAGHFSNAYQSTSCVQCQRGMYTATRASQKCNSCIIGTFSNSEGTRECQKCPEGLTTQFPGASSSVQCICAKGTVYNFNSGNCDSCPEGMVCDVGSNLSFLPGIGGRGQCPDGVVCTYPKVAPGYMSLAENPLRIYLCLVEEQCPGGEPGTCAKYRDSTEVACGRCAEGSYENGDNCELCEGGDHWVVLLVVLSTFVILLILMTFTVNKDISMQNNSTSLMLVLVGQLCTMIQTMGVFLNINIDWYGPLTDIFWMVSLLSFNLDFLKMSCMFRVNSFSTYLCRQMVAPAGVFWVALALAFKRFILKKVTHVAEEFTNTIGILFSMFFISIVISAVTPFICYRHPGASGSSLTASPSVLCFASNDHRAMLVVGIIAYVVVVVPFVVLAIYGTISYPRLIASSTDRNSTKLAMFRFLFFRFKGNTYYYGCLFLIRNLCICFVPVVIRENAAVQVLVMTLLLLGFCIVQLMIQPWRRGIANVCDGVSVSGMVLLLMLASVVNTFEIRDDSSFAVLGTVLFGITVAVSIVTIAWSISDHIVPRPYYNWFICHHKACAAAQARNVKILLQQSVNSTKVFIDADDLIDLEELFDTVRCKTAHLIVYLTTEILSRPWCAGEIVMAQKGNQMVANMSCFGRLSYKKKATGITCIKTLGFMFPSPQQLDDLEDYIDSTSMSLVAHNITIENVQRAYTWLMKAPMVELDSKSFGRQRLAKAVGQILKKAPKHLCTTATKWDDAVVISTDPDDDEATSTAAILLYYIERDVTNITQRPPTMFVESTKADISAYVEAVSKCRAVVVVLTHTTLQCLTQLELIVTAISYSNEGRQHGVIPVHTPSFTFPSQSFYEKEIPRMQMSDDFRTYFNDCDMPIMLKEFFNKISMYLATTASERVLRAQSRDVFKRIPRRHIAASIELEHDLITYI